MLKYLLNFLLIFLMLSSFAFARITKEESKLQGEFGQDLSHAPFFLRYSFFTHYKKFWEESNYNERKDFLTRYDTFLTAKQREEKAETKALADKIKARQKEIKDLKRKFADRLKADQREKKADQNYYRERQREFNNLVKSEERELEQMISDYQAQKR